MVVALVHNAKVYFFLTTMVCPLSVPFLSLSLRAALSEARAELAAAGDSFVKLEAIHRNTARGGRR